MSSHKRPWYKWYPRDFNQDEKVKGLGWDAELIYRRLLDVMWQSNDCQLPNDIDYLHNAVAIAIPKKRFATAWLQIQRENFKLFTEENGYICSERLKIEMEAVCKLSKTRRTLGHLVGVAKAKAIAKQKLYQKGSDTDTDTDIKKINKRKYLNFVFLTVNEHRKLISKLGQVNTDDLILRLNNYVGSKGKKYKSHYYTILSWARKEQPKPEPKQEPLEEVLS